MLSGMWDLPGSRIEQADSFTTELPRKPTSDPLYHLLSDSSPLEPSHVTVKMTFEVVLVLFNEAPMGPVVLSRGNFPFLVRCFFFFFFNFCLYILCRHLLYGVLNF